MANAYILEGAVGVLQPVAPPKPNPTAGCSIPGRIQEFDSYITPDGIEFKLSQSDVRAVLSDTGTGMPSINYITERGPFQHGVTLKDFFLAPRTIQMVVRQNFANRVLWYAGKGSLLNVLRPNRTAGVGSLPTTGVLRKYMPDGSIMDLAVLVQSGPKFEPRNLGQGWDEWSFQETLQFQAFNPVYFNPNPHSHDFTGGNNELVFPVTFPLTFGLLDQTFNCQYLGSWEEFPTFQVTGPITHLVIENVTTGQTIILLTHVPQGFTVTISLAYGDKSITRNDGVNLLPYLSPDSELATWSIVPSPIVSSGINTIRVVGDGTGPTSKVTMTWLDRYIGLQPLKTGLLVS